MASPAPFLIRYPSYPIDPSPGALMVGSGTASVTPPASGGLVGGIGRIVAQRKASGAPPVYYQTPNVLGPPGTGGLFNYDPTADTTPTASVVPPTSVYDNEPLEYPSSGNIAPSTDPYAYVDPTTGQVVSSVAGTSLVDSITAWVQANPILALALAGVGVWLLMETFGGKGHRR